MVCACTGGVGGGGVGGGGWHGEEVRGGVGGGEGLRLQKQSDIRNSRNQTSKQGDAA